MNNDPYRAPLFDIPKSISLSDDVICTSCRNSVWTLTSKNQLTCFCPVLHKDTWWNDIEEFRTKCDGALQADAEHALRGKGFAA